MYTSSSRGSKRKADKNVDADFTSCLALGEGKPAPPTKSGKPRNRLFRVSGLVTLVSSRRFPTQTTTVQQMADQPHPLRACSLVVWQCIAFATSFLLASQTTSVAATAPCMTTSYTTTKLSQPQNTHRKKSEKISDPRPTPKLATSASAAANNSPFCARCDLRPKAPKANKKKRTCTAGFEPVTTNMRICYYPARHQPPPCWF